MSGGLDIGMNSTARWSMVVPAMKVLDLPFVLTSYQAVDKDVYKRQFEHKPGSAENMGAFTLPANCDEMDYSAARAYFSMPRILPLIQA